MSISRFWRCLSLVVVLILILPTAGVTAADQPAPPLPEANRSAPSLDLLPPWALVVAPETEAVDLAPLSPRLSGAGTTAAALPDLAPHANEYFTNTWSYSTLGMVYDPSRDHVRYAHESQSSTSNPTIYDVYPVTHTAFFSFALSAVNGSWPWQLDNRTGAGYDFDSDTYFLPDYNGDLSYADDNIVEILPDGTIHNVWEMDDEVGSNDSSDGSEIDSIIDIAIVPGDPPRYFVTAAYDDNVVYEVVLTRTGAWWTPNSWQTVATCTVPAIGEDSDNLGIDYDAQNEVLYHSSWDTTTLVVTELGCPAGQEMVELAAFDCPSQGGYNSGVTYLEGVGDVWVTDFSSDQTTICESPYGDAAAPESGWEKSISVGDGPAQPWTNTLALTTETSDTITVVDVITSVDEFFLIEEWNPEELRLLRWDVDPPVGGENPQPGMIEFFFPPGPPEVVTITKWFHVEPCTWTETLLSERVEGIPVPDPYREFIIRKELPRLSIDSEYERYVGAGSVASFTLVYSNTGGRETDVMIRNEFPAPIAPFVFSEPWPDRLAPDGSWVEWDVGTLSNTVTGTIDVFVFISPTLAISDVVPVWDWIYNHVGEIQDGVVTEFEVASEPPPNIAWEKFIIRPDGTGEPWFPGVRVAGQVSETFTVVDSITRLDPAPFTLYEEWNPDHIRLVDVILPAYGDVISGDGWLRWEVEEPILEPMVLEKIFHIEPCTWTETLLWEELWIEGFDPQFRPVEVVKIPPDLWIESFFDVNVYPGEQAKFLLEFGNRGGYENEVRIRNTFPPEAPFVGSDPAPIYVSPDRLEVWWIFTEGLTTDQVENITVTVDIAEDVPPATPIEIWDGIYNHVEELADDTIITLEVPPPEWDKWVNGRLWFPGDFAVGALTSDTLTVTEVVTIYSQVTLVENWSEFEGEDPGLPNPGGARKHLSLDGYEVEPDIHWTEAFSAPGILEVDLHPPLPGEYVYTVTKWFHVEPCTWTYTILGEGLIVAGEEWERRRVVIDKPEPDMVLTGLGGGGVSPGQEVVFQLEYINTGASDREFGAWIRNTFPITAPFAWSDPEPAASAPDRTSAVWDLPPLEQGAAGLITVAVDIDPTLIPSETVEIWDGIYNHAGELEDWTVITYHVEPPVWHKWVNGEPWTEGLTVSAYSSDTITVTEVVYNVPDVPNVVLETWDPDHLELIIWDPPDANLSVDPAAGQAEWMIETSEAGVYTLTKWFHVRPCTWTDTVLWEELWIDGEVRELRPVPIEKPPIELTIDSFFDVFVGDFVLPGDQLMFQLQYTNSMQSDIEAGAWIRNTFPAEAPFAWSDPEPITYDTTAGLWAEWELPLLDPGAGDLITVGVDIPSDVPPSTTIEIWDGIYNHAGALEDWTTITFRVDWSIYLPMVLKDS